MKIAKTNILNDVKLLAQIIEGSEKSLEQLINKYSEPLCIYINQFTGRKDLSEEVVADVFINLWRIKKQLVIQTSIRAYLYRSCKNRALDILQKENKYNSESLNEIKQINGNLSPDRNLSLNELILQIDSLISEMPKQKQLIFRLSRIDGLKYREIAEVLSISINTVQNHMVEAVKFMANHRAKID